MPGQLEEIQAKRATFGMGCFWAGDSLFGVLPGVIRTCVGYAGGQKESPTYRNMYYFHSAYMLLLLFYFFDNPSLVSQSYCSGDHTEVVDIEYNPDIISYSQLLALFWQNHEYGLTTKIKRQVDRTTRSRTICKINETRFTSEYVIKIIVFVRTFAVHVLDFVPRRGAKIAGREIT